MIPKIKNSLWETVNWISLVIIAFWLISPMQPSIIGLDIVFAFVILLWLFSAVQLTQSAFLGNKVLSVAIITMVIYILTISVVFGGIGGISSNMDTLFVFLMMLCGLYFQTRPNTSNRSIILLITALIIVYASITIVYNLQFPSVSRHPVKIALRKHPLAPFYFLNRGVGGYNLCYSLAFSMPILFAWLLNSIKRFSSHLKSKEKLSAIKDKRKVAISLLTSLMLFIFGCVFLYFARFSLAIALVGIGCMVVLWSNTNWRIALLTVVLLLGSLAILAFLINRELVHVPDMYGNYLFKFKAVIDSVLSGKPESAVFMRWIYYKESLVMAVRYPLFGVSIVPGEIPGGHSFFLDVIAQFGVFFGGTTVILYITVLTKSLFNENKKCRGLALALYMMTLLQLTFNSMPVGIGVMIFIVYPNFCRLVFGDSRKSTTINEDLVS